MSSPPTRSSPPSSIPPSPLQIVPQDRHLHSRPPPPPDRHLHSRPPPPLLPPLPSPVPPHLHLHLLLPRVQPPLPPRLPPRGSLNLKTHLDKPIANLKDHTVQLSNLISVADLVAECGRVVRMVWKLRGGVCGGEVGCCEGGGVCEGDWGFVGGEGLVGVEVVEREMEWVKEVGERLRREGVMAVERGMDGGVREIGFLK